LAALDTTVRNVILPLGYQYEHIMGQYRCRNLSCGARQKHSNRWRR